MVYYLWALILGLGIFLASAPYIFLPIQNSRVTILLGIVLLGLPYMVWALKYNFAIFAVLDRSLSTRKAFRFSAKIAEGWRTDLFLATLTGLILVVACLLPGVREEGSGFFALTVAGPSGTELKIGPLFYLLNGLLIIPLVNVSWSAAYVALGSHWEAARG